MCEFESLPVRIFRQIAIPLSGILMTTAWSPLMLEAAPVRSSETTLDYAIAVATKQGSTPVDEDGREIIPDLEDGQGIEFEVSFNVESLENLVGPIGNDVRAVSVRGFLRQTNEGFLIEDLWARLGEYGFTGTLQVSSLGSKPRIRAVLESEDLVFSFQTQPSTPRETNKQAAVGRRIPDVELPFEAFRKITADLDIDLAIKSLTVDDWKIDDARLSISLSAKESVEIRIAGDVYDGRILAEANVELSKIPEQVSLDVEGHGIHPGQMPLFQSDGTSNIKQVSTDFGIKVRGQGSDLRAIASGLNGSVLVDSGEGQIKNNIADLIGASLLYTLSQAINPFAKDDKVTELQCAIVHFQIDDGVASANLGIAMETRKASVIASGVIDLETEAIDFSAKPVARQGLGINLSPVASVVRVRGTLSQPQFALGAKAAAVRIGVGIGTAGLSVLAEGLYSRLAADSQPCVTARKSPDARASQGVIEAGAGAAGTAASGAGQLLKGAAEGTGNVAKGAAKGAQSAVKGAAKAAGSVVKGAGRAIRGLFGEQEQSDSPQPKSEAPSN